MYVLGHCGKKTEKMLTSLEVCVKKFDVLWIPTSEFSMKIEK